jgi:hypothetical protein
VADAAVSGQSARLALIVGGGGEDHRSVGDQVVGARSWRANSEKPSMVGISRSAITRPGRAFADEPQAVDPVLRLRARGDPRRRAVRRALCGSAGRSYDHEDRRHLSPPPCRGSTPRRGRGTPRRRSAWGRKAEQPALPGGRLGAGAHAGDRDDRHAGRSPGGSADDSSATRRFLPAGRRSTTTRRGWKLRRSVFASSAVLA